MKFITWYRCTLTPLFDTSHPRKMQSNELSMQERVREKGRAFTTDFRCLYVNLYFNMTVILQPCLQKELFESKLAARREESEKEKLKRSLVCTIKALFSVSIMGLIGARPSLSLRTHSLTLISVIINTS